MNFSYFPDGLNHFLCGLLFLGIFFRLRCRREDFTPLLVLGLLACWLILGGPTVVSGAEFARALVGFVAGAIGCSAVSALIATLAPRFAVPIAVAWLLLLDATVGALDVGLHAITVSFGTKAIARGDDGLVGPLSLVIITVLALGIACYRVDKIE